MSQAKPSHPSVEAIRSFLEDRHGTTVGALEPLTGGFWSSAYAYEAGGRELVVRLGTSPEGFAMDRAAMAFASPALPIPEVLEIGEAFDGAYAISVRQHGRFLEDVEPAEAARAGPMLDGLLAALRAAPEEPASLTDDAPVAWRDWLRAGLVDEPSHTVSGWRALLAADPDLDALFVRASARVDELLACCPERRDLVHGDLLHQNVLVSPDASEVRAVFSWKCATRGDHLYDVAWCTFWSPWHPGIGATDIWARTLRHRGVDLTDAADRHHCYEVQIGASHLGWYAWTRDGAELRRAARHLERILARGPLPAG